MIFKILLCAGIVALFIAVAIVIATTYKNDEDLSFAFCGIMLSMFVFLAYFIAIETIHQILYGTYIT